MPKDSSKAPEYGSHYGPIENRKCRDVLFLLLYLIFWAAMLFVASIGFETGDPRRLLIPTDYLGQQCGVNNTVLHSNLTDFTTKPYAYFLNPFDPFSYPAVCVSQCPSSSQAFWASTPSTVICRYGYPQPQDENHIIDAYLNQSCAAFLYSGGPVLGRCLPNFAVNASAISQLNLPNVTVSGTTISMSSLLANGKDTLSQVMSDIVNSWPWLVGGVVVSVLVAFLWVWLMRWLAGIFVWISIFVANAIFIGGAIWLYFYWQGRLTSYNSLSPANQLQILDWEVKGSEAAFIVVAVIAGILLLVTLALWKRIDIAVGIIKETSHAIQRMPMIVFYPLVMWVVWLVLLAYFIIVMLYLASPTSVVVITQFGLNLQNPQMTTYLEWFHLFGFFWTWSFMAGFQILSLAGAFATYYWTLDKKTLTSIPLLKSIYRTLRYHMGSIAIGSLLIALVQILRCLTFYLQKTAKTAHNQAANYILACLQCVLLTIQKILQFINKRAYIHIAVWGDSFCKAAGSAMGLLIRNALRTAAIGFVTEFVLFLSAAAVSVGTGFLAYVVLSWQSANIHVNFLLTPVIFIGVEALVVALLFLSVYSTGITTIFMCFLEDAERNDGTPERPYYMSSELKRITGHKNKGPSQDHTGIMKMVGDKKI
ncbi:plasma-membrane choline transporter-domain-containing protein [Polychytrium aggregatum]|uniref:plasma-membrane choline transporter-domain-containing protein n=1 Tax=Polychytrium aggregatum TaxID=110093 RepID=UPI0022FF1461|nr:plasma-membrane choline transporter-domain-containing protein [Polychytrium aggregatum]KAI9204340.1 plasma-membrane choline transporter-domain-containing protein [Polychytrium aggregatum]